MVALFTEVLAVPLVLWLLFGGIMTARLCELREDDIKKTPIWRVLLLGIPLSIVLWPIALWNNRKYLEETR